MIKLVALDIDGTLLSSRHVISERNKMALHRAASIGVRIALLSGRNIVGMQKYIEELGLKDIVVSLNGAYIVANNKPEAIHDLRIEKETAAEIIKYVESMKIHLNYYHDDVITCGAESEYSREYARITDAPVIGVGSLLEYSESRQPGKLLLIGGRNYLEAAREWLEKNHSHRVNCFFSNSNYLEVIHKNASKGDALKRIAGYYNLSMDQVMAIGDGENDISMIHEAGIGVAMGNASEKVKKEADFITLSNDADGVAYAVEKFVLCDTSL